MENWQIIGLISLIAYVLFVVLNIHLIHKMLKEEEESKQTHVHQIRSNLIATVPLLGPIFWIITLVALAGRVSRSPDGELTRFEKLLEWILMDKTTKPAK